MKKIFLLLILSGILHLAGFTQPMSAPALNTIRIVDDTSVELCWPIAPSLNGNTFNKVKFSMLNKCELEHSDKLLSNEKFKVQYCLQCDSLWPILPLATESGEIGKEKNNPEIKGEKNKKKKKK